MRDPEYATKNPEPREPDLVLPVGADMAFDAIDIEIMQALDQEALVYMMLDFETVENDLPASGF